MSWVNATAQFLAVAAYPLRSDQADGGKRLRFEAALTGFYYYKQRQLGGLKYARSLVPEGFQIPQFEEIEGRLRRGVARLKQKRALLHIEKTRELVAMNGIIKDPHAGIQNPAPTIPSQAALLRKRGAESIARLRLNKTGKVNDISSKLRYIKLSLLDQSASVAHIVKVIDSNIVHLGRLQPSLVGEEQLYALFRKDRIWIWEGIAEAEALRRSRFRTRLLGWDPQTMVELRREKPGDNSVLTS